MSETPRRGGRTRIGRLVTLAGVGTALHSLTETAGHVGDPSYAQLPAPQGQGHVTYHLAREAFTTSGSLAAVAITALAGPRAGRAGWAAQSAAITGYLGGQWSGRATAGRFAPSGRALTWHVATTALLLCGTVLQLPRRQDTA
jgi:hypothetical protein